MSYTVLDLAKLSLAVYSHPPTAVDKWEPVRRFGSQEKHGFYAVLYRREQLHVLAYRGTDDWQVDLIDDAAILLGWISSQMGRARNALQASRERLQGMLGGKLCLTGHSLGGGLAALIAAQYDLPCVTFNAPGTKRSFKAHYIKTVTGAPYFAPMIKITTPHETNDGRILNIRARFDLVSVGTGPALGDTDSINVKCEGPQLVKWSQVLRKPSGRAFAKCSSTQGRGFSPRLWPPRRWETTYYASIKCRGCLPRSKISTNTNRTLDGEARGSVCLSCDVDQLSSGRQAVFGRPGRSFTARLIVPCDGVFCLFC